MSTYTDRFVAERLPPRSEWPVMLYPQDSLHGDSPLNLVSLLLDQPWTSHGLTVLCFAQPIKH